MKKDIDSKAYFYQIGNSGDTVAVTPSNPPDLRNAGYGRSDVEAGLRILLTTTYGYGEDTYIISPSRNEDEDLTVEVQFVGEGIVMAKLKGFIV